MSDHSNFMGAGVALVTPFTEQGEIDYDALAGLIEYVLDNGVNYIVTLGTTGEAVTLTTRECKEVIRFTIEQIKGRCPVVGGLFGSNNTAALIRYIQDFDMTGLDALLSSSPAYVKPSQEGIFRHYQAIDRILTRPLIMYNVPGRTASNISPETMIRLQEQTQNIIGVKEASGSLTQIEKLTKYSSEDFLILSGDDPTALATIALGGHGVISVIANAYPKIFSDLIRYALEGDFKTALDNHRKVQDIHQWLYIEGNPVGIKACMAHIGLCSKFVRLPLAPLSATADQHLKVAMDQIKA